MACYHPWDGYRGADGRLVTSRKDSPTQAPMRVVCGRCIGCRMDRAESWGTRIAHEAQLHEDNSFLTLTYSDKALPDDYSIKVRDLQLFFKRLRERISPTKVRYYACGEYGDTTLRPHYHVILFGYRFKDQIMWRKTKAGNIVYKSEFLDEVWGLGLTEIGTVTRQSGAYVARYCLKKIGGKLAEDHYQRLHPTNGTINFVQPEFAVMSSRPGIGGDWIKQYEKDCFPSNFIVLDGRKHPVPRYYQNKLKDRFNSPASRPDALLRMDDLRPSRLAARKEASKPANVYNNTEPRLEVREEIAVMKQKLFKRDLGED